MSTLQKAANFLRIAGAYFKNDKAQSTAYLEIAAELERMAEAKPLAQCAIQKWMSGAAYAEDCFSGSSFTGSVPVYAVPPDAQAQIDALKAELAEAKKDIERVDSVKPEVWKGAERWERLAWVLCAEENGEEACTELIWEGGPNPEPWGDRWLKYEGEAKRMIELVDKYARAALQETKEKP